MKKVLLITVLFLSNLLLFSQSTGSKISGADNPQCEIMQIGLTDSMTFVFFKCICNSTENLRLSVDENSYIRTNLTEKKYDLISCVNIPIAPSYHNFDSLNQTHYFALTYEAIPQNTNEIDIYGGANSRLNFYGISLHNHEFRNDSTNYLNLLEETPVKEKGYFYKDGKVVQYYIYKGLVLTMHLCEYNSYGDYYAAYISVENYTKRRIDFSPGKVYSIFYNGNMKSNEFALSIEEYMSNVKKEQAWNTFFVALGETLAASGTGQSVSTVESNGSMSSYSNGIYSGTFGDSYGFLSSNVRTYSNYSSIKVTHKYDAAAAYYASQNARKNIQNYIDQQYQINDIINEGYLKTNTLFPNQRINGYILFKYRTAENIEVIIPIKNEKYSFIWPFKIQQFSGTETEKSENEKLIDRVLKEKVYQKIAYVNFDDVTIGDLVTFTSEFGDDIYGIIEGKKGSSSVIIITYPSSGQKLSIEKKYRDIIHLYY